jgi:hypothetical protein
MATDDRTLAELLPGGWIVAATNIQAWLSADRIGARYDWGLVSASPLVLSEDVSFGNPQGGTHHVRGTNLETDAGFVWRGHGLQRFSRTHWAVSGMSPDLTILALRFSRSRSTEAGVTVLLREGTPPRELRAIIANNAAAFGLSAEDFATLTFIDGHASPVATPPAA